MKTIEAQATSLNINGWLEVRTTDFDSIQVEDVVQLEGTEIYGRVVAVEEPVVFLKALTDEELEQEKKPPPTAAEANAALKESFQNFTNLINAANEIIQGKKQ